MRKQKVLLVYPEMPTTYWSFKYALKFTGARAPFPPLGLITVAAMLPAEYEPHLVDMNVTELSDRDILQADLVFVSAMMVQRESFNEVVRRCNALGRTVVAGGPHPTASHEEIDGVDHFILGEAEILIPDFLVDYETGVAKRVYSGRERPDISLAPIPRFDLLDTGKYFSMSLQYSRGCPFSCEFCDIIELFGRKPRTKTPTRFIAELNALYATGYRGSVFIVDDNFIGNRAEVRKLLPAISAWQKERSYPYNLFTEASINLAQDDSLMEGMVEAGFDMVFLGIETPVEETLLKAGKVQNTKASLMESVKKIQRRGIEVSAGFIIGFDSDPDDIFDRQIEFIQDSGIVMAMVGLLMALPGTALYRRLAKEGRLLGECSGNNTHDAKHSMNFVTVMDARTLADGYRRVLGEIYRPGNYFARCRTLMERMPKHDTTVRKTTWRDIHALVRSLFRQTFSRYGFIYLRFLISSARKDIRLFPDAVRMSIMGHHFFRITADLLARSHELEVQNISSGKARAIRKRMKAEDAVIAVAAGLSPRRSAGIRAGKEY
jgi:radical SAM superfamily enzyme YgiQ (UPF0313 family)